MVDQVHQDLLHGGHELERIVFTFGDQSLIHPHFALDLAPGSHRALQSPGHVQKQQAKIAEELRCLSIALRLASYRDLGFDMPIDQKNVEPAIIVDILYQCAKRQRHERWQANSNLSCIIHEIARFDTPEVSCHLLRKIADHDINEAIPIDVTCINSHSPSGGPRFTVGYARLDPDF